MPGNEATGLSPSFSCLSPCGGYYIQAKERKLITPLPRVKYTWEVQVRSHDNTYASEMCPALPPLFFLRTGTKMTVTDAQGVVTRICTILTAATGLGDPYIVEMGMAHHIAPYTTEKSQSHVEFCHKVTGSRRFSGEVTRLQPNFR